MDGLTAVDLPLSLSMKMELCVIQISLQSATIRGNIRSLVVRPLLTLCYNIASSKCKNIFISQQPLGNLT